MEKTSESLRKVQSQAEIRTLIFFKWLMKVLPRWFTQGVVEFLFAVAYLGLGSQRRICMRNFEKAYGTAKTDQEYRVMTKSTIKNVGRAMVDSFYYVSHLDEFAQNISIEGEEYLKEALKLNRGVIGVTAHMGNFPLMFLSLIQKGYQSNVIIRPMRDEKFSEFMFHFCSEWGVKMIQTLPKKKCLVGSMAALKRNELLFILSDEVIPEGVPVKFFDTNVARTPGPMVFHQRIKSPVLPIFIIKEGEKFKVFIEKAIEIEDSFSVDENNKINIGRLSSITERYVRKYPLQWGGWLNKRWNP